MEKSELLDLLSQYDIQTLFGLGNDEWCALTNDFEKEMIEKIIFYVGECCQDEPVDIIIQQQKKILESISIVFSNMYYDYNGNMLREDDFSAELSLKIMAKKYICSQQKIAVPTKEDNTPDYEALQQLVTDYSSACEKMNKLTNELQAKANNHSQLLDLLMEYEKEKEKYKNIENELETLKKENEQLKMRQKELDKMSQNRVQKAEHEVLIKVLRRYLAATKRKDVKKRGDIKMVITELVQNARVTLPEDLQQDLEKFDDDNQIPTIGEFNALKYVGAELHNVEAGGIGVENHK